MTNFCFIFAEKILYKYYKYNTEKNLIMELSEKNIKLILGLKLKQIRQEKKLSLSDLSEKSTLSISYLNEIENGKKYPSSRKIAALAAALDISYDKLVSLKLTKNLAPFGELLESNLLNELPLDHYGIDVNKFLLLMSKSSLQLSALVSTLIEMAKSSELSQNNFSRTAIRTYKEFNENYFEELEESVENFREKYEFNGDLPIKYHDLLKILTDKFHYEIDEKFLQEIKELKIVRGIVSIKNGSKKILINSELTDSQKAFIIGKEIGYNFLNISDRSFIYSDLKVDSFDQLLNNLKASYFSSALIIKKNSLIEDLQILFQKDKWDGAFLVSLLEKYNASPDMLFQRITNLAAKYFNMNNFFFLRFNTTVNSGKYLLNKELRLNTKVNDEGYQNYEHYCRRWLTINILKELEHQQTKINDFQTTIVGIQKSFFYNSNEEYLCVSLGKKSTLLEGTNYCVTLGFLSNYESKNKVKFWNDPSIKRIIVNGTCERCPITDCSERAASPEILENKIKFEKIERTLKKIMEEI